jgi:hypothetical protein
MFVGRALKSPYERSPRWVFPFAKRVAILTVSFVLIAVVLLMVQWSMVEYVALVSCTTPTFVLSFRCNDVRCVPFVVDKALWL